MKISIEQIIGGVCGIMLLIVVAQAVTEPAVPVAPPPKPASECVGDPITVSYPYVGWSKPHACAPQCKDDRPRYVLYSDGKATQCETPPGCNDWGEDKGVTCVPPLASTGS